ncbi:C-type mannose receptor 2-like [Asterias amurensis]|uniref:C-type mannose receptor 2-like n=1 Tax=Asterias amurensis TaxID=7602 RepID=UPI003AB1A569
MSDDSSCPVSWHYWGNSCYKITETRFSWSDARDECRNLGGVLGVPSSYQENEFILLQLSQTKGMVWIDCNDLEVEGIWKCREGKVEVAYRNWYPGEPNNVGDEDCAVLAKGWWGSEGQCDLEEGIGKCRAGNVEVACRNWAAALFQACQCYTFMYDDSSCPESWHYWGNSCYKITEAAFSWADARDECRNLGGVLGAPSSDQENEFIAQFIPLDGAAVWIDCNDIEVEGRWKCREGNVEVAYTNWYPGEPNSKGDEDCAFMLMRLGEHQWHDVSCRILKRAICEMAGRPVLHV